MMSFDMNPKTCHPERSATTHSMPSSLKGAESKDPQAAAVAMLSQRILSKLSDRKMPDTRRAAIVDTSSQKWFSSMNQKLTTRLSLVFFSLWLLIAAAPAQENPGTMFAASDGKGHISLLWFPPASKWPAGGWRLQDSSGKAIANITMGDAGALQKLSIEDADAIRKLTAVLTRSDANPKQRTQLIGILGMRAFSEPDYARALGLSWTVTVQNAGAGSRIYK